MKGFEQFEAFGELMSLPTLFFPISRSSNKQQRKKKILGVLLHSHIRRSESRWLDQIVESLSSDDYFVIMGGSNDILSDDTSDSFSLFANMNVSLIEGSN